MKNYDFNIYCRVQYFCLENPTDGEAWYAAVHGVARVGHDWATSLSLFTFLHWRRKWQPTPVLLPGESQGRWSLVGCRLWGRTDRTRLKRSDCFFLWKTLWETNWKHLSYRMFQSFTHPSIFLLFVYFFISLNNITEDLVLPELTRVRRGKLWTNFKIYIMNFFNHSNAE